MVQPLPKNYTRLSQALPALKGIAAFFVVLYHIWLYTQPKWANNRGYLLFAHITGNIFGNGLKGVVEGVGDLLCLLGEHGVHFFLIASGFGLGSSWWHKYGSQGSKDSFALFSFWQRRLWRIFPLYWLAHCLALIVLIIQPSWVPFGREVWQQGGMEAIAALLASITTLRNLILKYYFFLNNTWWYIGLSVQLYLIFPLLVWIGKRWGWSILLIGSLFVSLTYRTIIIVLPLNEITTDVFLRGAFFPARLFEFTFGIILAIALLAPRFPLSRQRFGSLSIWSETVLLEQRWMCLTLPLWIAGFTLASFAREETMFLRIPTDAMIGIGEFCFVFQLICLTPLVSKFLSPLGNNSYGIYLTHSNIFVGLWAILTKPLPSYWLRFAVVAVITCLLGGLFEVGYHRMVKLLLRKNA